VRHGHSLLFSFLYRIEDSSSLTSLSDDVSYKMDMMQPQVLGKVQQHQPGNTSSNMAGSQQNHMHNEHGEESSEL